MAASGAPNLAADGHSLHGARPHPPEHASPAPDNDRHDSLAALTRDISRHHARSASTLSLRDAQCCCGREDCAYLRRSQGMLAELEKDVQTAATLGQALLQRHERSMQEAQHELRKMASQITALEARAAALEAENQQTVDENKELLATLEDAAESMRDSDTRVHDLQDELDAAHTTLTRVSAAAARTEILEAQLAVLEGEQQELRSVVATTKEEERMANARWKTAERHLRELNAELEKIERERAMEKARSSNILGRLEQRRLYSSQGQKSGGGGGAGSYPTALAERTAVSQFMKEILAENGHLQMGIAELRSMLAASQEEANTLRRQVQEDSAHVRSPLSLELSRTPSASTIVHHHHYHPVAAKEKPPLRPLIKRPKRRRQVTAEHLAAIGERGGLGIAHRETSPGFRRTSRESCASSSLPASPTSTFQEPSIFERGFHTETSRPTSADSNYHTVPRLSYDKKPVFPTSPEASPFSALRTTREAEEELATTPIRVSLSPGRPRLQRSCSHESLLEPYPSSHTSPAILHAANEASPSVTQGVAMGGRSTVGGSSAYNHLLGLAQEPPGRGVGTAKAGRWLWGWGRKGGDSPGSSSGGRRGETPRETPSPTARGRPSPTPSMSSVLRGIVTGYVDEELLKDSLADGPGSIRNQY